MIRFPAPDIIEYLDAVVARVGDNEPRAVPGKVDGGGGYKLPVGAAARSELEYERAVGLQYLDAVVARVGDGNQAVARDRYALRRHELAVGAALLPEHEGRRAVDVENVDAMVARVGDGNKAALRGERDGRGTCKLPDGAALRSEGADECAVRSEHLDSMVARVGDGNQAVAAYRGARGRHELAVCGAARSYVKGVGAARMKHANAIAGSVRDDDGARPQAVRCIAAGRGMRRHAVAAVHGRNGRQRNGSRNKQRQEGHGRRQPCSAGGGRHKGFPLKPRP